jgi:hypothetical protein
MDDLQEYDSYDVPDVPLFKSVGPDDGADSLGVEEVVVKPRKKIAKLDDDKLLGPLGIPRLKQKIIPRFKFKGKGHEKRDLAKILSAYQIWAHELFPRANFADFISICKKAGDSRVLKVHRRQWVDDERYGSYTWSQEEAGVQSGGIDVPEVSELAQSVGNENDPADANGRDSIFVDEDDDLYDTNSGHTSGVATVEPPVPQQLLSVNEDDDLLDNDLQQFDTTANEPKDKQRSVVDDSGIPGDDELALLEQEAMAGYEELGF